MIKRHVGKVLSEVMSLTQSEINKKQNKMGKLSVEDIRAMIPKDEPTEAQIALSKSAPVQITLLDVDNQPIAGQSLSIKKNSVMKTAAVTIEDGTAIYNRPEVMTCSIMPCSLEYNEHTIDLEVPEDATYADIEVLETSDGEILSEIKSTDGGILVGSSTDLTNWKYILDEANNTVILQYYIGSETDVIVYAKYEKDGVTYNTRISNGPSPSTGVSAKYMFNASGHTPCRYIESITFNKGIDMTGVYYMTRMFYNCTNLKIIEGLSNLDTSNVHNMGNMFYQCGALSSLDLSIWDVSNVENVAAMFMNCVNLISVNLSNWNTSKIVSMANIFNGCKKLTEIKVSRDKWIISSGCSTTKMFYNCGVDHVTYVD